MGGQIVVWLIIFVVFVLPAALLIASPCIIIWMMVTAQKQNREMGIPPWRFSLQALLIGMTLAALVIGMLAWGIRE
jgi:hypothetical protein